MKDVSHIRTKTQERPWYKPALSLLHRACSTPRGKKILDVGCGLCEFSLLLRNQGFIVTNTDGSERYVKQARKLGFSSKRADFNKRLPFQNNSFDAIACLEVIEHVENAEGLVKELWRVLKKEGFLVISTPNFSYWAVRLAVLFGAPPPDEGYHFRFFNYKTLRQLLEKEGFILVKTNSIFFLPLYKLFRRRKKFPRAFGVCCWENLLASKLIFLCRKR